MKKITYSDVAAREEALGIKNVIAVAENSRLYYSRLESNDTLEYAKRFITECAKDSKVASYYMEDLQKYADKYYSDPTVKFVFEGQIIPKITLQKGDTILEGHGWEEMFKRNQICDRILDNMQLIESSMSIDNAVRSMKRKPDREIVADRCCEAVCNFENLSLAAKVNIALEEAIMLAEKYDLHINDPHYEYSILHRIIDDIAIIENATVDQMKEVNLSLAASPVIDFIGLKPDPIMHEHEMKSVIEFFQGDRTVERVNEVFDNGFDNPLHVLEVFDVVELALKSPDSDLVDSIFGVLKEIPQRFMDQFGNIRNGIILYDSLKDSVRITDSICQDSIHLCKESGSRYTERYEEYHKILEEVMQNIEEISDFLYPAYNVKMIQEGVLSKAKGVISFMKASEKLGQITNSLLKARKWIKGKAQPMHVGKQLTDVIKVAGSNNKLLTLVTKKGLAENASLYEYLTPEGDFDIIIDRYITVDNESIDSKVLDMFSNICREMNDNIFFTRTTGCGSYFVATENMIEVRYFDNERVELTKEQAAIVAEQTINEEFDMPLIYELALYSSMPDDICDLTESELIRSATETLLLHKEATENDFNTFLELASQATIWYETVNRIFESVCEYMPATFRTQYQYAVETYRPDIAEDDEIALEALEFFKNFITEKVDYDEKYGNLDDDDDNDEDEDEDENDSEDDKDDEEEDDPKKEAKKKINPDKSDKKEEPKKEEKVMSFNNIKLFQMGLKKKMKDLSSKEQGFCRNLDSSFTRLVKAMQQALVSDRREAIIKGSVIPSFSKCIKWGCVMAGTAVINPVAPVITAIGAFAMSKKLTKKERTLLLDDIEIELKVVDKEIAMAESDNNTKKMRALMKEQRNLQRQYQRIKYNIRVGKDIIPGGTGGND